MYLIVLCITCILGYYLCNRSRYCKLPPKHPGWLPMIGHLHLYFGQDQKSIWEFYKSLCLECVKHGGVSIFSIGPHDVVDPEDAHIIGNACVEKHYIVSTFLKPWFGDGLLTANATTYKRTRKLMNSAFSQQLLVGLLDVFNSQAQQLTKLFSTHIGMTFNPEHCLLRNNLETVCKTAVGLDAKNHSAMLEEYLKGVKLSLISVYGRFMKIWLHSDFIYSFSDHKRKQDEILKSLHALSDMMLRNRKREIIEARQKEEKSTGDFTPLMDVVLEMAMDKGLLTEKEMRDELDTILFGGHDTSATTLNYALVLLGSNPSVQEKAYKEIIEVMGGTDRAVDKTDLTKLVYLDSILKETLRLYPLAPALGKVTHKEVKLKNYTIPAGSSILISSWAIHRYPMWGADPDEFRPERWLEAGAVQVFSRAFVGFGSGRRGCIGRTYAMMSMKTNLVHLLRQFRITADINKMTLRMDGVLKPVSGHDIKIDLRK